jgi:hypothetical protein
MDAVRSGDFSGVRSGVFSSPPGAKLARVHSVNDNRMASNESTVNAIAFKLGVGRLIAGVYLKLVNGIDLLGLAARRTASSSSH